MARSSSLFSRNNYSPRISHPFASANACFNEFVSSLFHRVDSFVGQSTRWLLLATNDAVYIGFTLGALVILIAFIMTPKKYWQTSASAHSSDSSAPSSIKKEYKNEHGQPEKTRRRRRRTWWPILAIATLLSGLVLGLSLGLTLGREHHRRGHNTTLSAIVDFGYSQYQRNTYSDGVSQWLGIRFAAPPIGDLRFAAPHDPAENRALQKANKVRWSTQEALQRLTVPNSTVQYVWVPVRG